MKDEYCTNYSVCKHVNDSCKRKLEVQKKITVSNLTNVVKM